MMKLQSNTVYTFVPNPKEPNLYGFLKELPKKEAHSDRAQFQMLFVFGRLKSTRSLPQHLSIKAVHNNAEIDVVLQLLPNHFYMADVHNVGKFYFCVEAVNANIYQADTIELEMGSKSNGKYVKLSCLQPVNTEFFERACIEHRFFFIGE